MPSAMRKPALKLVSAAPVPVVDTPEAQLADLFAAEAELAATSAQLRRQLDHARRRYAEAHDLMALPRMELLRTKFAPKVRP